MDPHTLNSLLLAKKNIEKAKPYCYSSDRIESTIGARSVQDALEDTFRACLLHIGDISPSEWSRLPASQATACLALAIQV